MGVSRYGKWKFGNYNCGERRVKMGEMVIRGQKPVESRNLGGNGNGEN